MPAMRPMPVMRPAPGASPLYIPCAASGGEFEERRPGVEQGCDPFARQQLAARQMFVARGLPAAECGLFGRREQVVDERLHGGCIGDELAAARIQFAFENRHGVSGSIEGVRPSR